MKYLLFGLAELCLSEASGALTVSPGGKKKRGCGVARAEAPSDKSEACESTSGV